MSPTTTTSTVTVTTTSSLVGRLDTTSTPASSASHAPSRALPRSLRKRFQSSSRGGGGISSISTPNLSSLFASHARPGQAHLAPPLPPLPPVPPPQLLRKASLTALTLSSLATIPDATESYAFDTLKEQDAAAPESLDMPPLTPGNRFGASLGPGSSLPAGPEVLVGDAVDVPGGMTGVVRFVGSVAGRKGVFAGVELHHQFAARGKNNGDVDGVSYFATTVPGAGIFLPLAKALRHDSPAGLPPRTPTANGMGLKLGNQNSTNFTPPTPSLPKFSQSVSGGGPARAPSPQGKRPPRTSLPRPDSPVRRMQMTPVPPRPSMTPAPRHTGAATTRFTSPTNKFSQSMRAPATGLGDPSKRGHGFRPDRSASVAPRSTSALGGASVSSFDDEPPSMGLGRPRMNGGGYGQRVRSPSRAMSHINGSSAASTAADEEVERLRTELDDRERRLKDQADTLADMESSLTELQTLMESPDGPMGTGGGNRRDSIDDRDSSQLRALLREKNDKIAMLTAEFDTHRADFRSTIDTLEMASTETERVYEKKIEEMMQEIHELESRTTDVDAVAQQLKQLEELVQELEEGLEDARRGEAEARGEVEFLRGEVERTRTELRREREKLANGNGHANAPSPMPKPKELEQKDDEIRGLKAIIHSLSRNPGVEPAEKEVNGASGSPPKHMRGESINERMAREKLERELSELRGLLESKTTREAEMEHELEQLRSNGSNGANGTNGANGANGINGSHRASAMTASSRSSLRDSRDTVVLSHDFREAVGSGNRSPDATRRGHHTRGPTLDTMHESDAYSSVTEASTLWCEICEANGHDILTCTNMFGPQSQQQQMRPASTTGLRSGSSTQPVTATNGLDTSNQYNLEAPSQTMVAPLSPVRSTAPKVVLPEVKILPNPMDSGPVAGKESGTVDADKWCALCERDGHDSVDCPFEDAF